MQNTVDSIELHLSCLFVYFMPCDGSDRAFKFFLARFHSNKLNQTNYTF